MNSTGTQKLRLCSLVVMAERGGEQSGCFTTITMIPVVRTARKRCDAPLTEHAQETLTVSPYKAYVEVIADFSSDGRMKPLRLIWEDGRKYDVDRILRVDRCASLKAGGAGIRYVCRILGQRVELYYEENGFWFVNRKTPRA